ncbi:MAG: hypothetical protein AAF560_15875 [Acidobacteriota bacterium]
MATFSIDIGFNRDLLRHPATSLAALLSQGVTRINKVGNPVFTARSFKTGDRVALTAYDLSAEPSEIVAMSAELLFTPALPEAASSPISGGRQFSCFKIYPALTRGESTVFEVTAPRWFLEYEATGEAFPCSQLQAEPRVGEGNPIELANVGYFYYTILLAVTWAGDPVTKNFRVDPEMITTSNSGGGGLDPRQVAPQDAKRSAR